MSILIKGMEMPKRCVDCPMCHEYYYCNLAQKRFGEIDCVEIRADWCPLISIPPHGRLVDADALTQRFFQVPYVCNALSFAPTIIEAEESWTQIVCSKCGGKRFTVRGDIVQCDKCGAKMVEEAEESK